MAAFCVKEITPDSRNTVLLITVFDINIIDICVYGNLARAVCPPEMLGLANKNILHAVKFKLQISNNLLSIFNAMDILLLESIRIMKFKFA